MPAAPSWAEVPGNLDQLQAHIMSDNYETVLRRYMEALGASDYATVNRYLPRTAPSPRPSWG